VQGRAALPAFGDHKNACGNGGLWVSYLFRFVGKSV